MNLPQMVSRFSGLRVAVIGEAIIDSYVEGVCDRLSQEAPVPIVSVTERSDLPGGGANTAANVAALGGDATLFSIAGDDADAGVLETLLEERGVMTAGVERAPGRRTLRKTRVLANSHMLVRYDEGTSDPIEGAAREAFLRRLSEAWASCDAVIISDYRYGLLTEPVIAFLARLQRRRPRLVVLDSGRLARYRRVGATAIKPNYSQAATLLGIDSARKGPGRADVIVEHGDRLLDLTGADLAAVTLDVDGSVFFERGKPWYRTYARPESDLRANGAGDTFTAAFALALAAGAATPAAAEIASGAAAVVVGAEKTAVCSAEELSAYLSEEHKHEPDLGRLVARVDLLRKLGRRIVFTNGVFDILHRGHITYLNRAKSLGDVLVVGMNSDASVARLKGPSRPINSLDDRIPLVAALGSVDIVTSFDDSTPERLIRAIRPDVYVKGGDYTHETLPEAALVESLGGFVRILPYEEDLSTTGIIERIRAAAGGGGGPREPEGGEDAGAAERRGGFEMIDLEERAGQAAGLGRRRGSGSA